MGHVAQQSIQADAASRRGLIQASGPMATSLETLRGGARIGLANATWPFAQLQIAPEQLVLQVKFLGTFTFTPNQVIKVTPLGIIPFFGKGVRIFHRVAGYPDKIVFWYLCANVQPLWSAAGSVDTTLS